MNRDKAHHSRSEKHKLELINIRKPFALLGFVSLTILAWLIRSWSEDLELARWGHWIIIIGVLVLQAVLSLAILEYLLSTLLPRNWSYRLAFLTSIGLGLIPWIIIPSTTYIRIRVVLGGVFGTFLGVLGGTLLHEGLWENNYPPPAHISEAIHRIHLDLIGLPPPPPISKRLIDVTLVIAGLVISTPIWVVCILILWLEDPGPVFFVKNSVGIGGKNFRQFKFRTMHHGAEITTGPVPAREDDTRMLRFGQFLRKSALDELPQLINILRGEMSFVGPRPQRTILVGEYLKKMPEFALRHRVLPGLSGLAQVAGDYYLTPRQKMRYDRLYTQHASVGFDLKLILIAFIIVFWLRWQPGWDGRLPRRWLRWGARR